MKNCCDQVYQICRTSGRKRRKLIREGEVRDDDKGGQERRGREEGEKKKRQHNRN